MSSSPQRFKSLRALNKSKDFRTLCASQALAGLGEWLATLALIALVWEKTHSAIASGVVLAFRILPAALLGSWLGSLVDRLDRKRVLVACNAGRAVGYSGVTVWTPEGKLIGRIRLPEVCANIAFGGPKRNRLFLSLIHI